MNYKDIKIGEKQIGFVRLGNQVVFPKYAAHENLVLWYDFMGRTNSDTKRTIAEDLSGNVNHGDLLNFAFEEGSGYQDGGLEFDGVDDYVSNPNELVFDNTSFTIELLIKVESITSSEIYHQLLFAGSGGQYIAYRRADNYLFISYYTYIDGVRTQTTLGANINLNDLTNSINHIALVSKSENQEVMLFFNGILVGNRITSGSSFGNANQSALYRRLGSGGNTYYNNKYYSVRKYNRALTPEEIAHNYQIDKQRFNIIE